MSNLLDVFGRVAEALVVKSVAQSASNVTGASLRIQGDGYNVSTRPDRTPNNGRGNNGRAPQELPSSAVNNARLLLDAPDAYFAGTTEQQRYEGAQRFATVVRQMGGLDAPIRIPDGMTYKFPDTNVEVPLPPVITPRQLAAMIAERRGDHAGAIPYLEGVYNGTTPAPAAAPTTPAPTTEIAASPERTAFLNAVVSAYEVKGADGAALPADATDAQKIGAIETALAARNIAGITSDGKLTRSELIAAAGTLFNADGTTKAGANPQLVDATSALIRTANMTTAELGLTALPAAPAPAATTVTIPAFTDATQGGAAAHPYNGVAANVTPTIQQSQVQSIQQLIIAVAGPDAVGPKGADGKWGPDTQAGFAAICAAATPPINPDTVDFTNRQAPSTVAFLAAAQTQAQARANAAAAAPQPAPVQPAPVTEAAAPQPAPAPTAPVTEAAPQTAPAPTAPVTEAAAPQAAPTVVADEVDSEVDSVIVTGRDDLLITINGANYNFGRANLNHLTPEGRNSLHQMAEIGLKAMSGYGWDSGIQDTDGRSGVRSEAAIRRFQEANGLPATGVADVRTVRQIGSAVTEHQLAQELKTQGVDAAATFAPSLNNISINPFVTALVADMRFSSIPADELAGMTATQKIERAFNGVSGINEDGRLTNAEATLIGRQLEGEARNDRAAGREPSATQRDMHQAFAGMMQREGISPQNYGAQQADLSSVRAQSTAAGEVTQTASRSV